MSRNWFTAVAAVASLWSCVGPMDPAGADGMDGVDGMNGRDGRDGDAGPPGPQGDAGAMGDPGAQGPAPLLRLLDSRVRGWATGNRDRLNQMIRAYGASDASFDPTRRPVAVFDWDNTILKNDIGDATLFWMLKHDKILQPAAKDWTKTSAALTAAATSALNAACDSLAAPLQPLPTSTSTACTDVIYQIYVNGLTAASGGVAAWTPASMTTTTTNVAYAWVSQLQAGYRPDELRAMARAAFEENNAAPEGAVQTVGSATNVTGYVRIYEQIRDLMLTLRDNGFDVWILTASPQYVVDAISDEVGVPAHHVIGIRPVLVQGLVTADLQSCGTAPASSLITFDEGKRCWINKVVFHVDSTLQLQRATDPNKRPVFVAGDSDTDIAMLKDARALKLVINRNKTQLLCNALANTGNSWLLQPMFIAPKAPRTTPYACTTAKDNGGVNRIVDENGSVFPADLTEPVPTLESLN